MHIQHIDDDAALALSLTPTFDLTQLQTDAFPFGEDF